MNAQGVGNTIARSWLPWTGQVEFSFVYYSLRPGMPAGNRERERMAAMQRELNSR